MWWASSNKHKNDGPTSTLSTLLEAITDEGRSPSSLWIFRATLQEYPSSTARQQRGNRSALTSSVAGRSSVESIMMILSQVATRSRGCGLGGGRPRLFHSSFHHFATTTSTKRRRSSCSSSLVHLRSFSSSSSNTSSTPPKCDVVQGPSLLRTTQMARPNPSLLFLPGLRSVPFWTSPDYSRIAYGDPMVSHVVQHLESQVSQIRDEYLAKAPTVPSDYLEKTDHNPLYQGKQEWQWHTYLHKGNVQGNFVLSFPQTSRILQDLRQDGLLFEGTPFGFSFFSTLAGGSTIAPHTAPMNLRLRIHLPLVVPSDDIEQCGIRVGNMVRPWTTDKAVVFDDSYDHSVWNHTHATRVVLLVDIWHPDISPLEKQEIVDLFQTARQEGLWKR